MRISQTAFELRSGQGFVTDRLRTPMAKTIPCTVFKIENENTQFLGGWRGGGDKKEYTVLENEITLYYGLRK